MRECVWGLKVGWSGNISGHQASLADLGVVNCVCRRRKDNRNVKQEIGMITCEIQEDTVKRRAEITLWYRVFASTAVFP